MTEEEVNELLANPNVTGFARQVLLELKKNFPKQDQDDAPVLIG